MSEEEALRLALRELKEAIVNEGSHPAFHRALLARHRRQWPTLWAAIDKLLDHA